MFITHEDGISVIAKEPIHLKCKNCNSPKSQQLIVFQKYAVILGISFVATGRAGIIECPECNFFIEEKQFDFKAKMEYDELSKQTKTPLKSYLGLFIALGFVAVMFLLKFLGSANTAEYAKNPVKGDIYQVELEDGSFTIYKIDKIKGDSVYFLVNQYLTDELSGIDEVQEKNVYYEELFAFSRKDLIKFYDDGNVHSIVRE